MLDAKIEFTSSRSLTDFFNENELTSLVLLWHKKCTESFQVQEKNLEWKRFQMGISDKIIVGTFSNYFLKTHDIFMCQSGIC
jgi:hypothetical protein